MVVTKLLRGVRDRFLPNLVLDKTLLETTIKSIG